MSRPVGAGGTGTYQPQILEDQLTLLQGAEYICTHQITTAPSPSQIFRPSYGPVLSEIRNRVLETTICKSQGTIK